MIRVFVCDEDRVQRFRRFSYGLQACDDLPAAQTRVDQEARVLRADEDGVPGAARSENADL